MCEKNRCELASAGFAASDGVFFTVSGIMSGRYGIPITSGMPWLAVARMFLHKYRRTQSPE